MSKYYYNGVLLPEIPAEVLAEHPYAWIRNNPDTGHYDLFMTNSPWYTKSGSTSSLGSASIVTPGVQWYRITMSAPEDAWVFYQVYTGSASTYFGNDNRFIIWSNHDIPNGSATSTTIYFGALPVLSETYITRLISSTEAEAGSLSGSAKIVDRESYSQNIVVDGITSSSGAITLDFPVEKEGFYLVDMLFTHSGTRGFQYTLGGKTYVHSVVGTNYYAIEHYQFTVYLSSGTNTVKFSGYSTSYAPMFDRFDIYEYVTYETKFLIRSGSTLYTVADGALSALTETEVTASLFQTYGVDDPPDGTLMAGLTDPEVLYWQDSEDELPTLSLTVKGTPPLPQMFTSEPMDLTHESIAGIDHAAVDASEDVRFAISFDGGTTWKAFDGSAWFDTSDTVPGMLPSTMNAITAEQWAEVVVLDSYMVRFWLPNVTAYVASVVMHYINP